MKRHKHLYPEICSFSNLLSAARKAQRGKRYTPATLEFNHRLESELPRLQRQLIEHTYRPGNYRTFTIYDAKPRLISAAPYRDRVVHHALCNVVEPIFERVFIHDSYACRKGKGTHAAADRLTHFMQNHDYALQCDVRKYFPSIDHEILKSLLRRKIACPETLQLMDVLIDHSNRQDPVTAYFEGDDLFTPFERRRGLPIGNQTSQFFSNVYLNPLDHFIKEELGCRAYVRYVDDFIVLDDDKERLWEVRARIEEFMHRRLRLEMHPVKQCVMPVTTAVNFVGYRIYPTHRRLRPENGRRFLRRLREMQIQYRRREIDEEKVTRRICSWIGHAIHADTEGLRAALFSSVAFSRA